MAAVANSVMNRMIDRGAVDPAKIRSIYKSATFPTTGYGYAHNLDPSVAAKIEQAFFTFQWEGSDLAKEFKKEGRFIAINHLHDWAVIRKIDAANGVTTTVSDGASAQCCVWTTWSSSTRPATALCRALRWRSQGAGSRADRALGRGQEHADPLRQPACRTDLGEGLAQRQELSSLGVARAAQGTPADGHDLPGVSAGRALVRDGERLVRAARLCRVLAKLSRDAFRKPTSTRAFHLLERVGLVHMLDKRADELSGGSGSALVSRAR